MAHFAELNATNVVVQVLVVHNNELLVDGVESESKGIDFLESLYAHRRWRQTSYSASFRQHFAGVGYQYDPEQDAFIPPPPPPEPDAPEPAA